MSSYRKGNNRTLQASPFHSPPFPVQAKDSDDDDDVTVTVDRDRFMDEFFEQVGTSSSMSPLVPTILILMSQWDSRAPNPCLPSSPSPLPGGGIPI